MKIPVPNAKISFAADGSHFVEIEYSATTCVPITKTRALATFPITSAQALGDVSAHIIETKRPTASPTTVRRVSLRSCTCLVIVQTEPLVNPRRPVDAAPTIRSHNTAGCL